MIASKTEDAVWQTCFQELPKLSLPSTRILVVVPHPDDETLGAGALIWTLRKHGVPLTVVAVTDGENAYDTSSQERVLLAHIRDAEQRSALAELGVTEEHVHRLRLTDSGLDTQESLLTEQLMRVTEPGMSLLAPWVGDFHPDHEVCARAASTVARTKKLQLISYFFWTWHRGTPDILADLPLRRFDASTEAQEAKSRALRMHRSQLYREDGEPILPERLLGPARWPFEVFSI